MQLGQLNRRIQVHERTVSKNAAQQMVEAWPLRATRWMNRFSGPGAQKWLMGQQLANTATVFVAKHDSVTRQIKPETHRLQDEDGTVYDITAAFDRDGTRVWWTMLATARVS